jgi:hypothetical protein
MPVPSFDEFIEPLLHYLAERSDGVDTDDAFEGVADAIGLLPADRLTLCRADASQSTRTGSPGRTTGSNALASRPAQSEVSGS